MDDRHKSGRSGTSAPVPEQFSAAAHSLPLVADVAAYCAARSTVISVHEHLGTETLEYPNGIDVTYQQNGRELRRRMLEQPWDSLEIHPEVVVAACLPMPWYRGFKRGTPRERLSDIYDRRNREILSECAQGGDPQASGSAQFVPLPCLIVNSGRATEDFARTYAPVLDRVCALKWHPAAEGSTLQEFIARGHLDLAAELGLPLIVHCARTGLAGDLDDMLDVLIPSAVERSIRVNVAHAGFLHPRVGELQGLPGIFTDCCPWSVIFSSAEDRLSEPSELETLTELIRLLGPQLLLGFDSPWHVQTWADGSIHGQPPPRDLQALAEALRSSGTDARQVAGTQGARFLFGP